MGFDLKDEDKLSASLASMQNKFNMESMPVWSLSQALQRSNEAMLHINAEASENMEAIARENQQRHKAILDTAKNTHEINEKVSSVEKELKAESYDRKAADDKNHREAAKWHRIDLAIAIAGVVVGVIGIIVGFAF